MDGGAELAVAAVVGAPHLQGQRRADRLVLQQVRGSARVIQYLKRAGHGIGHLTDLEVRRPRPTGVIELHPATAERGCGQRLDRVGRGFGTGPVEAKRDPVRTHGVEQLAEFAQQAGQPAAQGGFGEIARGFGSLAGVFFGGHAIGSTPGVFEGGVQNTSPGGGEVRRGVFAGGIRGEIGAHLVQHRLQLLIRNCFCGTESRLRRGVN